MDLSSDKNSVAEPYRPVSCELNAHSYAFSMGNHQSPVNPFKRDRRARLRNPLDYKQLGTVKFENDRDTKEFGRRMKEARLLGRLTQEQAARFFEYRNSSKLNKIENGTDTHAVPLRIIKRAAKIYDVTTDFLLGLADDWERDPSVCAQRQVGSWLLEHFERTKKAEIQALCALHHRQELIINGITRLLSRAKENLEYVERVQEINPEFDDLRGGSKLLRLLAETAEDAMGLSHELKKIRALGEVAKGDNINLDIFEGGD